MKPMDLHARFGDRLRALRSGSLTQSELAGKVGLSRTAITNIESGKQGITLEVLYRLASALGRQPAELLPPEDDVRADSARSGLFSSSKDAEIIERIQRRGERHEKNREKSRRTTHRGGG